MSAHPGRTSPLVLPGPQITKSLLMCFCQVHLAPGTRWKETIMSRLPGDGSSEAGSRAELINRTERALWGPRGGPGWLDWKVCWEVVREGAGSRVLHVGSCVLSRGAGTWPRGHSHGVGWRLPGRRPDDGAREGMWTLAAQQSSLRAVPQVPEVATGIPESGGTKAR